MTARQVAKYEEAAARLLEISAQKKALATEESELKDLISTYYAETGSKMIGTDYQIIERANPAQLVVQDEKLNKDSQIAKLLDALDPDFIKRSPDVTKLDKFLPGDKKLQQLLQKCKLTITRSFSYSVKHA